MKRLPQNTDGLAFLVQLYRRQDEQSPTIIWGEAHAMECGCHACDFLRLSQRVSETRQLVLAIAELFIQQEQGKS